MRFSSFDFLGGIEGRYLTTWKDVTVLGFFLLLLGVSLCVVFLFLKKKNSQQNPTKQAPQKNLLTNSR